MYLHVYKDNTSCVNTFRVIIQHVCDFSCFICSATELFLKAEQTPFCVLTVGPALMY